jgi:hypothetical protein
MEITDASLRKRIKNERISSVLRPEMSETSQKKANQKITYKREYFYCSDIGNHRKKKIYKRNKPLDTNPQRRKTEHDSTSRSNDSNIQIPQNINSHLHLLVSK